MWYKLLNYGVRGKIIDVIRSMYENIKSKVKYDNRLSNDFTCLLGVRQGECLSLFLFSMYVNDLEEKLAGNGFKVMKLECLNSSCFYMLMILYFFQKLQKAYKKVYIF